MLRKEGMEKGRGKRLPKHLLKTNYKISFSAPENMLSLEAMMRV